LKSFWTSSHARHRPPGFSGKSDGPEVFAVLTAGLRQSSDGPGTGMRISAIDARHAGVHSTIRLEPSSPTAVYL